MRKFIKNKKRNKRSYFHMMPAVFLSLFLILEVFLLTGMCGKIIPRNRWMIHDGNDVKELYLTLDDKDVNILELLKENGVELKENDFYVTDLKNEKKDIYVNRAFDVCVNFLGEEQMVCVKKGDCVGDVLIKLGISLEDGYVITPEIDSVVLKDTKIEIKKDDSLKEFRKDEYIKKQDHDYKNLKQTNLKKEETKSLNGKNFNVKKNDNRFDKKQKDKKQKEETKIKKLDKKTKNKNILPTQKKAEKKQAHGLNENKNVKGVPEGYQYLTNGKVTAYAPTGRRTSTGTVPKPGRTIAMDPKVAPPNSKVYIEGVGERIVEDSGSALRKGRIKADVFMGNKGECRNFGKKSLNIYIKK